MVSGFQTMTFIVHIDTEAEKLHLINFPRQRSYHFSQRAKAEVTQCCSDHQELHSQLKSSQARWLG